MLPQTQNTGVLLLLLLLLRWCVVGFGERGCRSYDGMRFLTTHLLFCSLRGDALRFAVLWRHAYVVACQPTSVQALEKLSALLGVKTSLVEEMLTQRVVKTRGEVFTKQLGVQDASLTRDAIVKSLYEVRWDGLSVWLVFGGYKNGEGEYLGACLAASAHWNVLSRDWVETCHLV